LIPGFPLAISPYLYKWLKWLRTKNYRVQIISSNYTRRV
jgi:hypothetical protein